VRPPKLRADGALAVATVRRHPLPVPRTPRCRSARAGGSLRLRVPAVAALKSGYRQRRGVDRGAAASAANRYALVFETAACRVPARKNPRAILFGPDARFIRDFQRQSGAARIPGSWRRWSSTTRGKEFRLRELLFPERAAGVDKVVVSEVNPERCARCHGALGRGPCGIHFPLWPGAYGERYRAKLSGGSAPACRRFLALQATHARYRGLLGVKRFARPADLRSSALSQYAGIRQSHRTPSSPFYLGRLAGAVPGAGNWWATGLRPLSIRPARSSRTTACGRLADFIPTRCGALSGSASSASPGTPL